MIRVLLRMSREGRGIFRDFIQTNWDLEEKMNEVGIPIMGVFNKDNLPRVVMDGCYVLNLDDSDGPGTHWTGFLKKGGVVIYFDSFGMPPPDMVVKKLSPCKIYWGDKMLQHLETSSCGYWVVAFFCWMMRVSGSNGLLDHYQEFIDQFDPQDQGKNEKRLKKFLLPF